MHPPSILIVIDNMLPGGMQRQVVELLKGLRRRCRFRTILAVLSRAPGLEDEAGRYADEIVHVERLCRFDPTPVVRLIAAAHSRRCDLVHAIGWMSGLAGLVAARALRLPIINGSIRAAIPFLTWHERISRWCALRSDVIVANSNAGLRAYNVDSDSRAIVITNGIDLERFRNIAPPENSSFCMVGNFGRYKDHATVIRALRTIQRQFPQASVSLVGKALGRGDQEVLARCRRLVVELGLEASVRFVTDTNDAGPWIAGANIGVLASNHGEGISNAILEYMALAKPVVVTDSGGNREVVSDGETGYIVQCEDSDAMAARVSELLRCPERAQRMGAAGRSVIEREFTLERMCARYEELYDSVLSRGARTDGQ